MNAVWLLPILGSLGGSFFLYEALFSSDTAPKQAAGAALACAVAILPYVLARSIQTVADNGPKKDAPTAEK
jgi:hypothetical protein